VFWRGKPLIGSKGLIRVDAAHELLQGVATDFVFLGREKEQLIFAAELIDWSPAELDEDKLNSFIDSSIQPHPLVGGDSGFAELRANMTHLNARDAELAATARAIFNWHQSHKFCAACGQQSNFAMDGWQRNCPECSTPHFPRTDPVVIMLITNGNSVLVGRSPGWPEGMYSLLAGFVEPGETLEAAVRREVLEESGIEVGEVSYLASQPWPFPSSLMFGCAGQAISHEITIDPSEIEDAIWVSKEEMALAFIGEHPKILPARKGAIAHFLLQNWLADTLD
jgi:NAD+ diphosphatase